MERHPVWKEGAIGRDWKAFSVEEKAIGREEKGIQSRRKGNWSRKKSIWPRRKGNRSRRKGMWSRRRGNRSKRKGNRSRRKKLNMKYSGDGLCRTATHFERADDRRMMQLWGWLYTRHYHTKQIICVVHLLVFCQCAYMFVCFLWTFVQLWAETHLNMTIIDYESNTFIDLILIWSFPIL